MTSSDNSSAVPALRVPANGRIGATDRVTAALREAIVTLELPPGAALDKAVLTQRFGVSRFPIAEALNRLKAEGLVEVRPQSGSRVSLLRLSHVHENLFLRRALEAEVAETLARLDNAALIGELRRNLRYQKAAAVADDRHGFHRLDIEFHGMLVAAVAYPRVTATVEHAWLALDRVRRMLGSPQRHAVTYDEHAAIVDALEARDAPRARAAIVAHIDVVMAELDAFSEKHPEVFADGVTAS